MVLGVTCAGESRSLHRDKYHWSSISFHLLQSEMRWPLSAFENDWRPNSLFFPLHTEVLIGFTPSCCWTRQGLSVSPGWRWSARWRWSASPPDWQWSEWYWINPTLLLAEGRESAPLVWEDTPTHLEQLLRNSQLSAADTDKSTPQGANCRAGETFQTTSMAVNDTVRNKTATPIANHARLPITTSTVTVKEQRIPLEAH